MRRARLTATGTSSACSPTRCGRSSRPSGSRAGSRTRSRAVTQAAAEELSDWAEELSESELRALRDPRNWVRPVVAVGAGGVATGALVLLEMRRRGRQQAQGRPARALAGRRQALAGAVAARAPRSAGVASAAPTPSRPRTRCRKLSLGVDRDEAEDRLAAADHEAPEREHDVDDPEPERVAGGRRSRRRSRPSAPVRMWTTLSQPLTARSAEHLVDLAGAAEEAL